MPVYLELEEPDFRRHEDNHHHDPWTNAHIDGQREQSDGKRDDGEKARKKQFNGVGDESDSNKRERRVIQKRKDHRGR